MGIYDLDNYWTSNTHTEAYTYDHLNRLATAVATGSGSTYNLTFGADRYGNMTCQTNGSTQGLCPNWSFDTTTNRINGFTYDAAGNLTNDGTHAYQWDAEGQMTAVDGGTTSSYAYDALGRRVYANIEGGNEFWRAGADL